jgi:hypothetical protein
MPSRQVAVSSERRHDQDSAEGSALPPLLPELARHVAALPSASPARPATRTPCRVQDCTSPPELMSRYQARARCALSQLSPPAARAARLTQPVVVLPPTVPECAACT